MHSLSLMAVPLPLPQHCCTTSDARLTFSRSLHSAGPLVPLPGTRQGAERGPGFVFCFSAVTAESLPPAETPEVPSRAGLTAAGNPHPVCRRSPAHPGCVCPAQLAAPTWGPWTWPGGGLNQGSMGGSKFRWGSARLSIPISPLHPPASQTAFDANTSQSLYLPLCS